MEAERYQELEDRQRMIQLLHDKLKADREKGETELELQVCEQGDSVSIREHGSSVNSVGEELGMSRASTVALFERIRDRYLIGHLHNPKRPGFLTIALVSGIAAWNEFLFAVTFIQDNNLKPIITSFWAFRSNFSTEWGLTSAAGLIVILPMVVLFLFLQRRFISGLTSGGLKG